jgi:hypothetical protein
MHGLSHRVGDQASRVDRLDFNRVVVGLLLEVLAALLHVEEVN